ncbi:Gag polyprotein [Vulpes lagopus]
MGETETTPLSLMLSHFSDVRERARILNIDIRRERFQIYCISEWPTFGVGWPREGTFHLPIILQVKAVIFRDKLEGHSDQVPYILIWQDDRESPSLAKTIFTPQSRTHRDSSPVESREGN